MALINKLSAIGDAIREKTGKEDLLTLDQMPEEIKGISGGGEEIEPIVLTGSCAYICAGPLSGEFIKLYGDKISTKDVSSMSSMFRNNTAVVEIPFVINVSNSWSSCEEMFSDAYYLKKAPKIKGIHNLQTGNYSQGIAMNRMFNNCYSLQEFPEDFFKDMCGEDYWASTEPYTSSRAYLFNNCVSLRKSPKGLEYLLNSPTGYSSHLYYNLFNNCYLLEEIELPVKDIKLPSSTLNSVCSNCSRLTHFRFQTNEDGSPKVITTWTNPQTLNLNLAGRTGQTYYITNNTKYHGIGDEKKVYDDVSYQALKNDPDWWANNLYYARYNHDSAVETINTLPDVSATGVVHTVLFTGDCGLYTDGGAIKTLTEEEIAVATNKGWTITIS